MNISEATQVLQHESEEFREARTVIGRRIETIDRDRKAVGAAAVYMDRKLNAEREELAALLQ